MIHYNVGLLKEVATRLSKRTEDSYDVVVGKLMPYYLVDHELTLREICYIYDISKDRVNKIETIAMRKLKASRKTMELLEYIAHHSQDDATKFYGNNKEGGAKSE